MLHDYKLGLRMLVKYPGLTLAGGLALAIAIGVGAGWYDLSGKILSPVIPLPEGDRLVTIETANTLTNEPETRVMRDFLEWRHELRTIEDLGAFRTDTRNLHSGAGTPEPIQVAELTAAAFATARVSPLLGRGLLDSDAIPGAPAVVLLGYDVWQHALAGRQDVLGSSVQLGNAPATVVGIMPKGFGFPFNHDAWTPLALRTSYAALEGGPISVVGRLVSGVSQDQANAELRLAGERTARAFPATHEHLRPRVSRLGGEADVRDIVKFTAQNLPVLLVLIVACTSVGTLVYARTATREGEIAIRSALGASRARILGQLFVEALVLASAAAAAGLIAADWTLTWGIEAVNRSEGGAPFWMTPGLELSTVLYAGALAVVTAAMLSILPALKVTRARVQPHLANLGSGGATLRFGRVWTGAMILQVAITAIGIPSAIESANQTRRKIHSRSEFPSRDYLSARVDLDRQSADEKATASTARRAQAFAALSERVAREPGVVAITYSDRVPGEGVRSRFAEVESSPGAGKAYDGDLRISTVAPGFFATFDRPIVAGRTFDDGDTSPSQRTVVVNEAFARVLAREAGLGSPVGARLRYPTPSADNAPAAQRAGATAAAAGPWYEVVGVVRDLGLDPDDDGHELPFVFHAASAAVLTPVVMSVRTHGSPASLAARLPMIATIVDARLLVQDARPLDEWIRSTFLIVTISAQAAVTMLVLFLSALGIFSLVSVSVSRRTPEIGLRAALGANPRQVLGEVLSRGMALMGSGLAAGGALLMLAVGVAGLGPTQRGAEDATLFAGHLAITSVVMIAACLLACIGPARRALRINPTEALRES
jgi:predicted permease